MEAHRELRGPFTRLLARTFVPEWRDAHRTDVCLRLGVLGLRVAVAVNALLFAAKLAFGLWVGSLALIADAVDSLGDVFLDGVGLVGLHVSRRGPDSEHPYGHERAEDIATLTVAVLLVVTGLAFAYIALLRVVRAEFGGAFSAWALAVALVSVFAKWGLTRMASHLGTYTGSTILAASAWHYITDVFSGLLAAGAIVARRFGAGWVDPVFALLIALLIVGVGVRLFHGASDRLLGRGAGAALHKEIHLVACRQAGVLGCSDIEVHWYGRKRRVSMRVQVDDRLSLTQGHEIATRVERAVHGLHADWEPVVHVDPVGRAPPHNGS